MPTNLESKDTCHWEFNQFEKEGLYKAIYTRRDIREQFYPDSIPEEVLARVLYAAHHAPSVGFMQPWNFILIRDIKRRQQVHASFLTANAEAVLLFEGEKREKYSKLKLEGILETPLNICITCDRSRFGPVVIGRTTDFNMDMFSTVCAVQNLWLAARAEGLGVGWVSILHQDDLRNILELPDQVIPIAYLCIGYVKEFPSRPELETKRWLSRLDLKDLVFSDSWQKDLNENWSDLYNAITSHKNAYLQEK